MSVKRFDLLTLGEVLMRLSPERDLRFSQCTSFAVDIGGAEANVAAGAAALGLHTGLLTKLPDHAIGEMALQEIRKTGVDTSCVLWDENPQARLGIYYYEKAASPRKPRVVYDRKHSSILNLRADDIPEEIYASTKIFHTSGITLGLDPVLRAEVTEMIRRFSAAGTQISFDVNFRSNLWSGPEAKAAIEAILPMVDIFFCSKSTARLTFGRDGEISDVLQSFAEDYNIAVVAATHRIVHSPRKHSFTSFVYEKKSEQLFTEEPYRDIEVTDRIGSGDAYLSGFFYGLLENGAADAMVCGNAAGALKNTIAGDVLRTDAAELRSLMEMHSMSGEEPEMIR